MNTTDNILDQNENSLAKEIKSLRQTALKTLARREYSYWELQQKLLTKSENKQAIISVLDKLKSEKLLDDYRFAEAYIRMRSNRGYGHVRIQNELHQRGITDQISDEIINTMRNEWLSIIISVRKKRFGSNIPKDFNERAKQMRFLEYRGFTHDQIKIAMHTV
jgi:regulatory protein